MTEWNGDDEAKGDASLKSKYGMNKSVFSVSDTGNLQTPENRDRRNWSLKKKNTSTANNQTSPNMTVMALLSVFTAVR